MAMPSLAQSFYFFCMGTGAAALFVRLNTVIVIDENIINLFLALNGLAGVMALAWASISMDLGRLPISLAFAYVSALILVAFFAPPICTIATTATGSVVFPLYFHFTHQTKPSSHAFGRLKNPLQMGWIAFCSVMAAICRRILWPIIFSITIRVPVFLATIARWVLRLINAGGAQKAIATMLMGLLLFLLYYAEL
jgi:hypothetical protein